MSRGPMADCYVLAPSRRSEVAREFLNQFMPRHTPTWDPSDLVEVLGVPRDSGRNEIFDFLERNSQAGYSLYLRNAHSDSPYYAILTYCEDGCLILGLSTQEALRSP